jgi:predicted DNA-binding protein with PD1-like motif
MHSLSGLQNFKIFEGHLRTGEIGVTGELLIEPFDKEIELKLYQETGFRLLALEED